MEKRMKIESICADYSESKRHVFDVQGDPNNYDCHNTCVIWNHITFYGTPFDLLDDRMASIYQGDYRDAVKIGELLGCLILCRQLLDDGEDPLVICEYIDEDLGYAVSALSDEEDGPISAENGDPYQDVYYIHQLIMDVNYEDKYLKSRIINELPGLVLTFCHAAPDILAFYPAPSDIASDQDDETIGQDGQGTVPLVSVEYHPIFGQQLKLDKKDTVDSRQKAISRSAGSADSCDYEIFENNGFKEVGDSGLLYKFVEHR